MGIGRDQQQGVMRAVFLDRDGVVNLAEVRNGKPYPPASLSELVVNPEAPEALDALKRAGYVLIVVTNQPDVARGAQSREEVERMHAYLANRLPIDAFYACFHDGPDHCECRKPKPGMLLQAARDHALPLNDSFLIGDRWRDVEAGHSAGVRTVFIDYGYDERLARIQPDATVKSLREAVNWILNVSATQ